MILDLTPAPPVNWPALRLEWAAAHQAANTELDTLGGIRPATIQRMRAVAAMAEAVLAIALARVPE